MVHLRLYSGCINAPAIQTKPIGFPSRSLQSAVIQAAIIAVTYRLVGDGLSAIKISNHYNVKILTMTDEL
ncbi:MAG TPA: hypothetical protein DDW76_21065 [Cyanobacteria bacterium UBA11369]|nr:hypothetical protein [Cyanobacteria bacterium UBA11369]